MRGPGQDSDILFGSVRHLGWTWWRKPMSFTWLLLFKRFIAINPKFYHTITAKAAVQ